MRVRAHWNEEKTERAQRITEKPKATCPRTAALIPDVAIQKGDKIQNLLPPLQIELFLGAVTSVGERKVKVKTTPRGPWRPCLWPGRTDRRMRVLRASGSGETERPRYTFV